MKDGHDSLNLALRYPHRPALMASTPTEIFAANLRHARERKGWSQTTLARHAELSLVQIYRFESAHRDPRLTTIYMLARALGVAPSSLIRPATGEDVDLPDPPIL